LEVSGSGGLIVRDEEAFSLIADMPKTAIARIEVMNSVIMRVTTGPSSSSSSSSSGGGSRVAVRFADPAALQSVVKLLHDSGVTCTEAAASPTGAAAMPDLTDPVVQEFVLQLLFREDFEAFCADIADLFDDMREVRTCMSQRL
jgi:hypothetical protein